MIITLEDKKLLEECKQFAKTQLADNPEIMNESLMLLEIIRFGWTRGDPKADHIISFASERLFHLFRYVDQVDADGYDAAEALYFTCVTSRDVTYRVVTDSPPITRFPQHRRLFFMHEHVKYVLMNGTKDAKMQMLALKADGQVENEPRPTPPWKV